MSRRTGTPARAEVGQPSPTYGRVRSATELGRLCRAERKQRGLTLAQVYESTALSTRFLSEMERGKSHASVTRALRLLQSLGLDVVVLPRAQAEMALRALQLGDGGGEPAP